MDMVNQKWMHTMVHQVLKEVQISGFQLISQEYLDFIQDSKQKRQNQEKSLTSV